MYNNIIYIYNNIKNFFLFYKYTTAKNSFFGRTIRYYLNVRILFGLIN